MIWTTYPDRICYRPGCDDHEFRVLLPEEVRIAWRRMSSWGIRMELRWIAMRAPCHQGEGSLHLIHADGPPCDARISHSRNSVWSYMSESSDQIFHIRHLTPDGRARRFNFPGQTYPDLLIALTRRASAADISAYPESIHGRHFRLPGFCAVPRCFPEAS